MGRLIIFSFFLMLIQSCNSDSGIQLETNDLEGKWDIIDAFRDGRRTQTLKKGYFEFKSDTILKTNILKDTFEYEYILNRNTINVDDLHQAKYTIKYLANDTLVLDTRLSKFDFRFVSIKSIDDEPI